MVAIASISLLVGGIGIMNIMLASILERTREIGVRRAVGARQSDIIRQFVVEAILISFVGGSFGIVFGFIMSRLIAWLAGWSTIVTASSILLAFVVSITVGLVFGIYPGSKSRSSRPSGSNSLRVMGSWVILPHSKAIWRVERMRHSGLGLVLCFVLVFVFPLCAQHEGYRDYATPQIRSGKLEGRSTCATM